jgi:hypothetical protein
MYAVEQSAGPIVREVAMQRSFGLSQAAHAAEFVVGRRLSGTISGV